MTHLLYKYSIDLLHQELSGRKIAYMSGYVNVLEAVFSDNGFCSGIWDL